MKTYLFTGAIDVDDTNFNVAYINANNKSLRHFKCAANVGAIIKKLNNLKIPLKHIKLCYEATYLGYSLYRDLTEKGIKCEIIAPSLIPKKPGQKIKTDRVDCIQLAEYYINGLLTTIYIPNEEDEMVRDLIRSRTLLSKQIRSIKTHIISLCKRMGHDYRKFRQNANVSYWTQPHYKWLEKTVNQLPKDSPIQLNLTTLLSTISNLEVQVTFYDEQIKKISEKPKYSKEVKALNCFRGLDTLSSLTLITEFGDIKRFPHPSGVTSYAGLSIREYSSGGKELRLGITKQGNHILRTVVVEASQYASNPPVVSRYLKSRREGADPEFISIADRCMHRLHKKSKRLHMNGKHRNKIKVACAREMLCFIWEALNKAA